ncbi:DUF6737 family protein [Vulcanococcus sp.]|jgi:hypothetical protein|uniref:DUF6737 family protein n=1 Tax=Vulcanococcus sp. TaxID=2856995 RepID=UPI003C065C8C
MPASPMPELKPSFWSLKPWWCQPWSILLTGFGVVAGSWWWLRIWWITAPLGLAVLLWWMLFLVLVPSAYRADVATDVGEEP